MQKEADFVTPHHPITLNPVRSPVRAASFLLRLMWAVIVLLSVCLLWLGLFALFLPFLVLSELLGWRAKLQRANEGLPGSLAPGIAEPSSATSAEKADDQGFIFDRREDVSKLYGCNTRSVEYRWWLFARRLAEIKSNFKEPNALDFGAGSLRDSYELSKLGFNVTSVDLDDVLLGRYQSSYDWKEVAPPQLFTDSLDELIRQTGPDFFHLTIAFDVIEHLEDPAAYVSRIRSLLNERGLLFTIVPNGRSIFEKYFKHTIRKQRERNIPWTPGVPHIQFKSPNEWEEFFEANGFTILEHDMTIGFFVNDCWIGLLGVPLRVYVSPVLALLAFASRRKFDDAAFEQAFCPAWLMERVNTVDMTLKRFFRARFGWNLIVAQKHADR
jgi:SAM-dependent methyltransferase